MKTLIIYNIVATFAIIGLSIWIYSLQKDAKETEEVLLQCLTGTIRKYLFQNK